MAGRDFVRCERLDVLRAGFDGRAFDVQSRAFMGRVNDTQAVEHPAHGADVAELALAKDHADVSGSPILVVGHALDDDRDLMRREAFVGDKFVDHGVFADARERA